MAEYISPGESVEIYDDVMQFPGAVRTDVAGFVGLAEKGPVTGAPVLIDSFERYGEVFGGYLSNPAYEPYRYLPYAVEQFFVNGGSCCYVMRVEPSDTAGGVTAETFIGEDRGLGRRTGIQAFLDNREVNMIAVPGVAMREVMQALIAHCENMQDRFAILDMPIELSNLKEMLEYRDWADTRYAAMYHPWIRSFDRVTKHPEFFPSSGAVMGVYARTDKSRGVHRPPANESVRCTGLSVEFTTADQSIMNSGGINLIRQIPGKGIRICNAKTVSMDATFQYVNVSRLFIFLRESIRANTNWVRNESNDQLLRERVRADVTRFMDCVWHRGMLAGETAEDAYYLDVKSFGAGKTALPGENAEEKLVLTVGAAMIHPKEYITLKVEQRTKQ